MDTWNEFVKLASIPQEPWAILETIWNLRWAVLVMAMGWGFCRAFESERNLVQERITERELILKNKQEEQK